MAFRERLSERDRRFLDSITSAFERRRSMSDFAWLSSNGLPRLPKIISETTDSGDDSDDVEGEQVHDKLGRKQAGKTTEDEKERLDPALIGMSSGLKHLYAGKEDRKGHFKWRTTMPKDVGKPVEDAETQKWALLVRHVRVHNDPEKVITIHSIVIQSPLLKEVLKGVLKGYPGVTVDLKKLEFRGEAEPLIHRWHQLKQAVEQLRIEVHGTAEKPATTPTVEDTGALGDEKPDAAEQPAAVATEESAIDSTLQQGPTIAVGPTLPVIEVTPAVTPTETSENGSSTATATALRQPDSKATSDTENDPERPDSKDATQTATDVATTKETVSDIESGTITAIGTEPDHESKDVTKLRHAELLVDLLSTEYKDILTSLDDMLTKGVMTYDTAWALFQPGAMIFTKMDGQERVCRLSNGRYALDRNNQPVFMLKMSYVEYDGTRFGFARATVLLPSWTGTRAITSLLAYPLAHHKEEQQVRDRLIARGAKLEALAGSHYRSYDGVGWKMNIYRNMEKFAVRGRIMVDTYGWNRNVPDWAISVSPLTPRDTPVSRASATSGSVSNVSSYHDPYYDDSVEDSMSFDGLDDIQETKKRDPLSEEQKLMCTHMVRGYSLKQKEWLNLSVNCVSDIRFSTDAFDALVIPDSLKELIFGFTSAQKKLRHQFDDVIEGKGRGIIILLCGPPGVGKTLTAESVAEEMQVPLFVMSAGDVGYDSSRVEGRLLDMFEMVTRWNAVLLLDEADIFLEERSLHEIERNKIVSIFLRVLEYYEGIMFMTTNRVQTLDLAFQSRIHISLEYPDLTEESRQKIWTTFLLKHDKVQAEARKAGIKKLYQAACDAVHNAPAVDSDGKTVNSDGKTVESDQSGSSSGKAMDDSEPTALDKIIDMVNDESYKRKHTMHAALDTSKYGKAPAVDTNGNPGKAPAVDGSPDDNMAMTDAEHVEDITDASSAVTKVTPDSSEGCSTYSPASSSITDLLDSNDLEELYTATEFHCIKKKEIQDLARINMNGRQIKNVLKTAQLLAQKRKENLTKKHITDVLKVTQHLYNASKIKHDAHSSIFH